MQLIICGGYLITSINMFKKQFEQSRSKFSIPLAIMAYSVGVLCFKECGVTLKRRIGLICRQ